MFIWSVLKIVIITMISQWPNEHTESSGQAIFYLCFFFFFFCIRLGRDFINAALNNGFCAPFFYAPCQSETFYAPALDRFVQLSNSSKKKKIRLRGNKLPASQGAEKKAKKKKSSYIKRNGTFRNATRSRSCPQDKGAIKCVLPNLPLNVGYWKTETKTRKTRHRYLSAIMPEAH